MCSEYLDEPKTFKDLETRLQVEDVIAATLEDVAEDRIRWRRILKCRVCGRYWALEYPYSERHGGGPRVYYFISTDSPDEWLHTAKHLATEIRRDHEVRVFWSQLGPEAGPERCAETGCEHKRVAQSSRCRRHHFEMMMGRKYLLEDGV